LNKPELNIEHLIAAYLSKSISDKELEILNHWKNENSENEKEFKLYVDTWERSCGLKLFQQINASEDWCKVKAKLSNKKTPKINRPYRFFSKVAAVLLPAIILTGVGLYWTTPGFGRWDTASTDQNTKEITLPDSSKIILNSNSKIIYLKKFNQTDSREIKLNGEAYFKVSHNKQKPFTVKTDNILVSVLGTEFNVNDKRNIATVSVTKGKVKVSDPKNNSLILTKGESAIYNNGKLTEADNNTTNDIYWLTQKLVFEEATLSEICKSLQKAYPEIKSIKFNAKKSDIKITTSFNQQTLKEVIEELHIHFGKKFTFNGKVLTISD